MGIFSKKVKHPAPDGPPPQANSGDIITQPLRAQKPENARAPRRGKKFSVDPVDFLALRSELSDLKARLEASEQARAYVETRLAALDITTTAMAADRTGGDAVLTQLAGLQAQLGVVAEAAADAHTPNPDLLARLEALTGQVDNINSAGVVASHGATDSMILARLEELAQKVNAGPGPDTVARIDQLAERVAGVDLFGSQLSQINARVTAQAEFGAQLSTLRDRIAEMSNDTEDPRVDAIAAQIAQLEERVAANDSTTAQATEQVAAIEERLAAVSTELVNQVSELGRDIDNLAAQSGAASHDAVSDEVIEHLKTAQVKLASEQARYEIAFRQDLATLAEQVRRRS